MKKDLIFLVAKCTRNISDYDFNKVKQFQGSINR